MAMKKKTRSRFILTDRSKVNNPVEVPDPKAFELPKRSVRVPKFVLVQPRHRRRTAKTKAKKNIDLEKKALGNPSPAHAPASALKDPEQDREVEQKIIGDLDPVMSRSEFEDRYFRQNAGREKGKLINFDLPEKLVEIESGSDEVSSDSSDDSILGYSFETPPPGVSSEEWAKFKVDLIIDNIVKLQTGMVDTKAYSSHLKELTPAENKIVPYARRKKFDRLRLFEVDPFRYQAHKQGYDSPPIPNQGLVQVYDVPIPKSVIESLHRHETDEKIRNLPPPHIDDVRAPVQLASPRDYVAVPLGIPDQELFVENLLKPVGGQLIEILSEGTKNLMSTVASASSSAFGVFYRTIGKAWFQNRKENPRDYPEQNV